MKPTRRDLCRNFPLALLAPVALEAQVPNFSGNFALAHSTVFDAHTLPVKDSPSGSFQAVVQGRLITGEHVEIHNTVLMPGKMPHPPHKHQHAEFMMIREGRIEWQMEDKTSTAGPGDILYAASMQMHGMKNIGDTPARYTVIAIGPDVQV